jgi:hypothetical protein
MIKIPKLSKKQMKELARQGKLRDSFEIWVDRHNHKLELVRTIVSFIGAMLSALVFMRIFKIF